MRDLTGAPGYEHIIDKTPDLAMRLCNWDQKNYIMAFGLDESKQSSENLKALGLISGHSYGVIAAAYVQDGAGNEIYLIQIRNPWGGTEWSGDWSDKSDKWTPELKD